MVKTPQSLFLLAILLTMSAATSAQDFKWPRKRAMEAGAGAGENGYFVYGGYVYFFPPKQRRYKRFNTLTPSSKYVSYPCKHKTPLTIPPGLSAKLSLFYEQGSGKEIRYRTIGMDAALLYAVYYNRILYVHIKGGANVSNDALLTPLREGSERNYYNRFKFGVLGGLELEWLLNRRRTTSFILGWDQRYLFNKDDSWGTERWYGYAGIRFKVSKKNENQ